MTASGMVGRVYRWRNEEWRVLCRWASPGPASTFVHTDGRICVSAAKRMFTYSATPPIEWRKVRGCPRNVLIENTATGERLVRPFRGLRRLCGEQDQDG